MVIHNSKLTIQEKIKMTLKDRDLTIRDVSRVVFNSDRKLNNIINGVHKFKNEYLILLRKHLGNFDMDENIHKIEVHNHILDNLDLNKLLTIRKELRLTLTEMGAALGMSAGGYEIKEHNRGLNTFTWLQLKTICKKLGVRPDELVFDYKNPIEAPKYKYVEYWVWDKKDRES